MDHRSKSNSALRARQHKIKTQSLGERDFSLLFTPSTKPRVNDGARSFIVVRAHNAVESSQAFKKRNILRVDNKRPLARLANEFRSISQKAIKPKRLKVKHTRIHSLDSKATTSLIKVKAPRERQVKDAETSLMEMKRQQLRSLLTNGNSSISSTEFYTLGPELGKGSSGKVYQATHILTGEQVAIKCIDKARLKDERKRRKAMHEIQALYRCHGNRVIRLYEVIESKAELQLVLELMDGGDLYQYVKANGALDEPLAKHIFVQLVQAVKHVHSLNIAHRDIKLDNVLLSADARIAKLCDFSICRIVAPGVKIKDFSGTPAYLAPEVLINCEHDPLLADMWSLGVLLYSMLHAALPFRADDIKTLQKIVLTGEVTLSQSLTSEAKDLITRLLEMMPAKRPRSTQVLNHPWLQEVHSVNTRQVALNTSIISHMRTLGFNESTVRLRKRGTKPT